MNKRLVKLAKRCGYYSIALHLKNREYSLEQALILLGVKK